MDYNELTQDNFLSSCGVVHTYNTSTQGDPKLVRGQSKLCRVACLQEQANTPYSRPVPLPTLGLYHPGYHTNEQPSSSETGCISSLGFLTHLLDQVNLQPIIMRAWLLYTCPADHWWENKVPLELGTWIQGRKQYSYSPQSRQISGLQ